MVESLVVKRWVESFAHQRLVYARFTPRNLSGHFCAESTAAALL